MNVDICGCSRLHGPPCHMISLMVRLCRRASPQSSHYVHHAKATTACVAASSGPNRSMDAVQWTCENQWADQDFERPALSTAWPLVATRAMHAIDVIGVRHGFCEMPIRTYDQDIHALQAENILPQGCIMRLTRLGPWLSCPLQPYVTCVGGCATHTLDA